MHHLYLWGLVILGIMTITTAAPHPHHRDDALDPVIRFLKELRKARKHSGSGRDGIRDGDSSSSESGSNFNTQSQSQSPSVPILFPSGGGGSSGSNNDQRITVQFPSNFPTPQPHQPSSPQDIQRINNGVSTILNGVRSFDLGQILRGAFIFPTNNNVKSVANNVLDTIFGPGGNGGGGGGGGDAPLVPTRDRN